MFKNLRQRFYPKEFRIKTSGVSIEKFHLEKILENIEKEIKKLGTSDTPSEIDPKFIKEIGTSIWSLKKRINKKSIEGAERALDKISSFFAKHEIEIKDYAGSKYDSNELWDKVLGEDISIEENETIIIKEMGKPRIIYRGAVIQNGTPIL